MLAFQNPGNGILEVGFRDTPKLCAYVLSNSFLWKNSCIGFRKTVEFLITQLAKEIPVLEFVSKENCKTMPQWEQLHRDIIADKENGEVILLEGSHYLHFEQKKAIVERTIQWIENR